MSRIKDPKLLAEVRKAPCCIDGCNLKAQAAHIKSKGSGGDDTPENVSPLCYAHHSEQHTLGWPRFREKHPEVKSWSEMRYQVHICWECLHNGIKEPDYMVCANAFKIGLEKCKGYLEKIGNAG